MPLSVTPALQRLFREPTRGETNASCICRLKHYDLYLEEEKLKSELELKKRYKCEMCEKPIASYSSLQRHIKLVHSKIKTEPAADPDYGQPIALNTSSGNILDELVVKEEFNLPTGGGGGGSNSQHEATDQQRQPLNSSSVGSSNSHSSSGNGNENSSQNSYPPYH